MLPTEAVERIPDKVLDEHWAHFLKELNSVVQASARSAGGYQKDIAARIGKKPSFVCECIKRPHNMTLRTLHDLARGSGYRLEVSLIPL